MIARFILLTNGTEEIELARKPYMSLQQAFKGFNKIARETFASPEWVCEPETLFTGYWRDRETRQAIVMR